MKDHQMETQNAFNSRIGFVLASVGSAVGMGNIWMFPYRVGSYGGAAFLIPYFIFVALFSRVGLSGEFAFGRLSGTGPIGSYHYAFQNRNLKGGRIVGAIPLLGSLGIAIGYAIIVGWVLRSVWGSLSGEMFQVESTEFYNQVTGHFGSIPWHLIVVLMTVIILIFGVLKGIERINKVMMPAFFILFIILGIRVAFLPGAMEGYRYLLMPKWEYLFRLDTWVMAMGQAFFSLSITGSGMIIYGCYLSKKEDIPHAATMTGILDTIAALISGFAIIPAVFAFGMDPASGPPLMFITLPKVFQKMPMGRLFAAIFFLSVLFAGITSLVNMLEVCTEALQKEWKVKRTLAVSLVGAVVFGGGIFLEYEPYMGRWMDFITIYVVPFGAVLGAITIYWILGKDKIEKELAEGRKKPLSKRFFILAKYIYIPLAILVFILGIIYGGIG